MTEILGNQVLVGRACLKIAQGIWDADPVVRSTAPTFFGLTLEESLQLAQIHAARLYDENAISIYSLISEVKKWLAVAKPDDSVALQSILHSESRIEALEPILTSIVSGATRLWRTSTRGRSEIPSASIRLPSDRARIVKGVDRDGTYHQRDQRGLPRCSKQF
jgi:hypothetical protein